MTKIAVFISGYGSNLQTIIDATEEGRLTNVELALVVSNRREAYGVKRAIRHGIPLVYFPLLPYRKAGRSRADYDDALATLVRGFGVEWIVLAGWMHLLSNAFIDHFPSRILNLHPALPGTFPGTDAIERAYKAWQSGDIDHTGVMVHLVPDEAVDAGPVIAQAWVPILPDDTLEILESRIHDVEHHLLLAALRDTIPA
jgi:formyltetrahydrofolate-dependent phosphoribosylglycinamide formyltransferase